MKDNVVVKELLIKMRLQSGKQGAKNQGQSSGQLSPAAREILIQECIDRVMKELENKNER